MVCDRTRRNYNAVNLTGFQKFAICCEMVLCEDGSEAPIIVIAELGAPDCV